MDTFWIRTVSQAGIYGTFALYWLWSGRNGRREWVPLLGTVVYAVVFEHFNMLRYAQVRGGYAYHPASWLFLWNDVPLYIPLAWAFIVSTSRALTNECIVQEWAKPFVDALLALLIDMSLDIIAIRLHFWTWRGVDWQEGFFGVPPDNFLGWLLVTFTFSLLTRMFWKRPDAATRPLWQLMSVQLLLIPTVAYLLYLALEAVVHSAYWLFHAQTFTQQFGILAGVLLLFIAMVAYGNLADLSTPKTEYRTPNTETHWRHIRLHGPRHIFHVFALIGFFCLPLASRSNTLLIVACGIWLLEWLLLWHVSKRAGHT